MSSKSSQNAVSRMMQATDPDAIPKEVSLEEKVRLLEMQNKILRFHLSAQLERGRQSSPEDVVLFFHHVPPPTRADFWYNSATK